MDTSTKDNETQKSMEIDLDLLIRMLSKMRPRKAAGPDVVQGYW